MHVMWSNPVIHQQDASCSLELLHGRVEVKFSHMGKLINTAVDEETLEASNACLDHRPKFTL